MATVKISPKYQIVIPREVREAMKLRPGDRLMVFPFGDRIELVPVKKISELRGFLPGLDSTIVREKDRL